MLPHMFIVLKTVGDVRAADVERDRIGADAADGHEQAAGR